MVPVRTSTALVCLVVVTAGCAGIVAPGDTATEHSTPETPQTRQPYPEAPEELTNESARRVAYQYETAHLDRRLANAAAVESYTLGATTAPPRRTVVSRNESGVFVQVQHPYGYSTEGADVDGVSRALYRVNESAVVMIERYEGLRL